MREDGVRQLLVGQLTGFGNHITLNEFGDFGAGSAVSVILATATLAVVLVYWRMLLRADRNA